VVPFAEQRHGPDHPQGDQVLHRWLTDLRREATGENGT